MLKNALFLLATLVALLFIPIEAKNEVNTLQLAHVLFSDGNRTVKQHTYLNDPHRKEIYEPYGFAQLTNEGKVREFRIGKAIRHRYDKFLGRLYTPQMLDSLSLNNDISQMGLLLVFAALYPPTSNWNHLLNWQPIPYKYVDKEDHLLSAPISNCPAYTKLYEEFVKSPAGLQINNRYKALFNYLSEHTGENITTNDQVLDLYKTLIAQEDWPLTLPLWTKSVYPKILEEAAGMEHIISTYTNEMRQLSGGFLLKKIIADSQEKIFNTLIPADRKLFLYAGHDRNLGQLLGTLNIMFPHNPSYGSYIMLELHHIDGTNGFKVYYQNYKENEPTLLEIPGCGEFCPFDEFVSLTKDVVPKGDDPCNSKNVE